MSLRRDVLRCFKYLHKIRNQVFTQDAEALNWWRLTINEEFKKNKNLSDEKEIQQKIKEGTETGDCIKAAVIQMVYNEERDVYKLRITKDTHMLDHFAYHGPTEKEYISERKKKRNKDSKCSTS